MYVRKKWLSNENQFYIREQQGVLPIEIIIGKDELMMPKSSWKKIDISLTTKEIIHDILDATSMIPLIGTMADVANAVVYAVEENYAKMAMYLGFATFSLATAGSSSATKKVGIKLTEKEGTENFLKKAEKMTASEYEKKYGKVYVEEVLEKEVKITVKLKKAIKLEDIKTKLEELGIRVGKTGNVGKEGNKCRLLITENPEKEAERIWNALSEGHEIQQMNGGKGVKIELDDGTLISYRTTKETKSNSPAIEIRLRKYNGNTEPVLKDQKIHFEKGK